MTIADTATHTLVPGGTWRIDRQRSRLTFEYSDEEKHHVGGFREFDAEITPTSIRGTINAASVEADQPGLTAHLRSPDFLGANLFPEITFESTDVEHVAGDLFTLHGVVRIGEAEQEVTLDARVDATPRVVATGEVGVGEARASVTVDAYLVRA